MTIQNSHASFRIRHPSVDLFAAFAGLLLASPLIVGVAGLVFLGS